MIFNTINKIDSHDDHAFWNPKQQDFNKKNSILFKSKTNIASNLKYKELTRLVLWTVPKEITLHFSCSFTWIQLKKSWFFFRVTSCIVTCSWLFFLLLKLIPYGLGMGSFWVLSHLRSINYAKFFNIIITSV